MANLDAQYDVDNRTAAFQNHERGILVCLAGPGTGKTYSLLARSEALAGRGVDQDSICYLTFIRAISAAFVDDYVQRFGEDAYAAAAPRISTLHSFACRTIRNLGYRINYDGELFFMNLADRDRDPDVFLADLLPYVSREECHTVPQLRAVVEVIKHLWQDGEDPLQAADPIPEITRRMVAISRCYRLLDWDQTIPVAEDLLASLDEPPEWISRIKHYFLDEYQDFNRAEQGFISRLAQSSDSMVIVGDDDQSLYGSRGGSPDGIRTLFAAPENDTITLVKCYRCRASIVTPTNTFQAHMSVSPRPLIPAFDGGQVLCYRFKSRQRGPQATAHSMPDVRTRIADIWLGLNSVKSDPSLHLTCASLRLSHAGELKRSLATVLKVKHSPSPEPGNSRPTVRRCAAWCSRS